MKKLIIVLAVIAVVYGAIKVIDAGERVVKSYQQSVERVIGNE